MLLYFRSLLIISVLKKVARQNSLSSECNKEFKKWNIPFSSTKLHQPQYNANVNVKIEGLYHFDLGLKGTKITSEMLAISRPLSLLKDGFHN